MIALLCPGQGSQTPGMLNEWLEIEGSSEFLTELSEAAKVDLISLGTTGSEAEIKDTSVAQPLIVASSLLTGWILARELGPIHDWAGAVAGHSVGEFAATALAGVLAPSEATALVGVRGQAMAQAASEADTGMAAVIGPDPDTSTQAIINADLVPANVNGGGQIVAAGLSTDIEAFAANPPERTRVIPLPVAGAFHTSHMAPAVAPVRDAAQSLAARDPQIALISNANGQQETSGEHMRDSLVSQITSPVRWDLCQETLKAMGVSGLIELAPAGVLTGLARRSLKGTPAVAIKSPADLDAALRLVNDHLSTGSKDAE